MLLTKRPTGLFTPVWVCFFVFNSECIKIQPTDIQPLTYSAICCTLCTRGKGQNRLVWTIVVWRKGLISSRRLPFTLHRDESSVLTRDCAVLKFIWHSGSQRPKKQLSNQGWRSRKLLPITVETELLSRVTTPSCSSLLAIGLDDGTSRPTGGPILPPRPWKSTRSPQCPSSRRDVTQNLWSPRAASPHQKWQAPLSPKVVSKYTYAITGETLIPVVI